MMNTLVTIMNIGMNKNITEVMEMVVKTETVQYVKYGMIYAYGLLEYLINNCPVGELGAMLKDLYIIYPLL